MSWHVVRNKALYIYGAFVLLILSFQSFFSFLIINNAYAQIAVTKHNLSTSGPGPVKATQETQICVFCHTPHRAVTAPLWNRAMSRALYIVPTPGSWPTLKSRPQNPPDGDSKLCLSCHDGTIAIGSVVNLGGAVTTISMQPSPYVTPEGMLSPGAQGYIGTDLSGHHPVSFEFSETLAMDKAQQCDDGDVSFGLTFPSPPVKLRPTENRYGGGASGLGVQCTSCHDPHVDPVPSSPGNPGTQFLRIGSSEDSSDLCYSCHFLCQ